MRVRLRFWVSIKSMSVCFLQKLTIKPFPAHVFLEIPTLGSSQHGTKWTVEITFTKPRALRLTHGTDQHKELRSVKYNESWPLSRGAGGEKG